MLTYSPFLNHPSLVRELAVSPSFLQQPRIILVLRIKSQPVTDDELKMVKTQAKANLIRGLRRNGGVAGQLATYQATHGDWRELFRSVERIEKVTKEDIMRVAQATFKSNNRTVAMIVNDEDDSE